MKQILRLLFISVCAALFGILIRTLVFQLYTIPTSSMVPTLITGDFMVVSKYAYGYGSIGTFGGLLDFPGRLLNKQPRRGEIIVFTLIGEHAGTYIKRLVGLPGDHVRMVQSALYVNGEMVKREPLEAPISFPGDDEPTGDIVDYIEYLPGRAHIIRLIRGLEDEETVNNTPEFIVPPHQYFFMGDNRDNSTDSRVAEMGFVPEENLVGKAEFLFLSLEKDAKLWDVTNWPWAIRHHRLMMKIN